MAVVGKPLRLKDLLELDCDSCSAAGFRCYPRHLCVAVPSPVVRHEPAAEAAHGVLGRSPSLRHPMLSIRSLSRRLFSWSRRDDEEVQVAPALPAASTSFSSYSESSESGPSSSSAERTSESDFSSASSAESLLRAGVSTAADGQELEAMENGSKEAGSGSEADDKEQLSPVAVMDFPFHDEEDDASSCSPSFSDSLAQLQQRRNIQLKHKIRRFRSVGEVPAAAVDLSERFAASVEPDGPGSVPAQYCCPDTDVAKHPSRLERHLSQYPDEHNLIAALLTRTSSAADGSERLLLDFFAESRRLGATESCEAAAKLAQDWILGTGARWGMKEVLCGREDLLAEIDRGQRWSSRVGEEREVGVVMAGLVIDELLRELVNDLLL